MDTVFIKGLKIDTIIGIYDWERETLQTVLIDLEMSSDIASAAASEDISDAVDYEKLSIRVSDYVIAQKFQLIETMAEKVAGLIREEFSVDRVAVTVHKPGALDSCDDVGVSIVRG